VKAVELGDDLRRTASRIDRDYKVSDKVKEFSSTVQEKADEVDQKFSVRRKAVTAWEDFQRNWPVVSVFYTSICLSLIFSPAFGAVLP
jgi:hypothetical protein